jgi:hypothetical protein
MKKVSRLKATAALANHPHGYVVLTVTDYEGGAFELEPRMDNKALYLPDPNSPSYRLAVTGESPEALERFAKAVQALARTMREADANRDATT